MAKNNLTPQQARIEMRKLKEELEDNISPDVYYAYFLLTMQWLGLEQSEEQYDFVKESIKKGIRQQMRFKGSKILPYFEQGKSTLFDMEFDEYVNEAWIDFLEKFEISEDYQEGYSVLSEAELDVQPLMNNFIQYLNKDYAKHSEKFPFISLKYLLMRSVQKKVENNSYKDSKNNRNSSIDDETSRMSQQEDQSANFVDSILTEEVIQSAIKKLDDKNKKIVTRIR